MAIHPTSGNLFISDDRNGIYEVQSDGTITHILSGLLLDNTNGLVFDASGRLLIAEAGDRIVRVDPADEGTYQVLAQGFNIP